MKAAGAKRMSKDSVIAMRDFSEQFAQKLAGVAVSLADHAGRKTVKRDDVRKAASVMEEGKGYF